MAIINCGIDPGKATDPAAIIVSELDGKHRLIRYIESVSLGTPYTTLRDRVLELDVRMRPYGWPNWYIERNGAGESFIDLLKETSLAKRIWSLYTSSGDTYKCNEETKEITIGKSKLVGRLVVLFEQQLISLPGIPATDLLLEQLRNFGYQMSSGNIKYEAETGHDDLVMAMAIACYEDGIKIKSQVGNTPIIGVKTKAPTQSSSFFGRAR
jgi:hypothetical protein